MKWYWHIAGGHTHVRVFMNGGKCGDLCFRNEEFRQVKEQFETQLSTAVIDFREDNVIKPESWVYITGLQ